MTSLEHGASLRGWIRPGEVLTHIGLPKTGTTALQHALAAARPALARHHICYPGRMSNQWASGVDLLQVTPQLWPGAGVIAKKGAWQSMVAEVKALPSHWRHVVSAESLDAAAAAHVDRLVSDLGAVRVVVGVRSLQSLLPSAWQQRVKGGLDVPLDEWLADMLDGTADLDAGDRPAALNVDRVVERWSQRVGTENVAVVVVKGVGRSLLDVFENMLSLEPATLQISTNPLARNRGLTVEEADLLRRFNARVDRSVVDFADYRWSSEQYQRLIQSRPARGATLTLPQWAVPTVQRIADGHVKSLSDSGVHIIGDLSDLLPRPVDATLGDAAAAPDPTIEVELGVDAMVASLERHIAERTQPVHPLKRWTPPALVDPARRIRSAASRTMRRRRPR